MKHVLAFASISALLCALGFAQPKQEPLKITYPKFALAFYSQPQSGDAVVLPFLEGRATTGNKERFGVFFQKVPASTVIVEIIDEQGKILKSVTVGDFMGKNSTSGVKLVSARTMSLQHRAEVVHDVALPAGNVRLITRVMKTADAPTQEIPAQMIVSFIASSASTVHVALRVALPLEGTFEAKPNGAVVTAKTAPAAIGIAAMGKTEKVEMLKNVLSVKSSVVAVGKETPVIWLVIDGSANAVLAAAKSEAGTSVDNLLKIAGDPLLRIVNTASKESTLPGDTVTYAVYCKNIGGGAATDVVLTNPVPVGTLYIENSAVGEKTEISVEKDAAVAPQMGRVKLVRWKLLEPLTPGNELVVNYRITIQ